VDINQLDWEDPRQRKQRFITLGDAWHVVRIMSGSSAEAFNSIVLRYLGDPLPRKLLEDWRRIYEIRNSGSHAMPLSRNAYETVLENALSPANLHPLIVIKEALSRRT
jgi:hypothetical protein